MEFRCRLVTASGEIVEGTYAAENEARLRHEFENQGLHSCPSESAACSAVLRGYRNDGKSLATNF